MQLHPGLYSFSTLVPDSHAHVPAPPQHADQLQGALENPFLAAALPGAIPHMYDMPIGLVNRVLYRDRPPDTAVSHDGNSIISDGRLDKA